MSFPGRREVGVSGLEERVRSRIRPAYVLAARQTGKERDKTTGSRTRTTILHGIAAKHRRSYAPGRALTFIARFVTVRKSRVEAATMNPFEGFGVINKALAAQRRSLLQHTRLLNLKKIASALPKGVWNGG